ncbi:MAG: hypothetical protein JRD04_02560 [Deltaproteobacteria bacterium]|nr:hypothetical protein [Deltaproteobacteria bacterium]
MSDFNVAKKVTNQLLTLTEDKETSEAEMQLLLERVFKKGKGKNTKTRIKEAAAIAVYHRQTNVPVVDILLADDAPQFKKITEELALCWIHEGRHYNRLDPIVPCNIDALKDFKTRFWNFYGGLLKYKNDPSSEKAEKLSIQFDELFSTKTIEVVRPDIPELMGAYGAALTALGNHLIRPVESTGVDVVEDPNLKTEDLCTKTFSTAGRASGAFRLHGIRKDE